MSDHNEADHEHEVEPEAPVCPGCGAVAIKPVGWLTSHDRDCTWLNDPDAEPYS